jgi:hypothetical protein
MSYELNPAQSEAFAQMLLSGVSPAQAVLYFFPEGHPQSELESAAKWWPTRKSVTAAMEKLQGKKWLEMTVEERAKLSLDKDYSESAFLLMSRSYADADVSNTKKLDTCREMLEKKLAGAAGNDDPLVRFYQDVLAGKVPGVQRAKVPPPAPIGIA